MTPVWDDEFELEPGFANVREDVLTITVYDKDKVGENTPLGYVSFALSQLLEKPVFDGWLPLSKPQSKVRRISVDSSTKKGIQGGKGTGELKLAIAYGTALPPPCEMFIASVVAARGVLAADKSGTSDPYVQIKVPGKKTGKVALKTGVIEKVTLPLMANACMLTTSRRWILFGTRTSSSN